MNTELWPHQTQALEDIKSSVRQGVRRLVVQCPTGGGKTLMAAAIVEGAQRKGNRMAFVVPRLALIDQTVEKLHAEGIDNIGVIQADHQLTDWSKPVQVCSIQTIRARKAYPEAKVVVIDECHEVHKEHVKWLTDPAWKDVPFIGLSATPWTRGLGKYWHSLLVVATTSDLIKQNLLSKFRVFAADHPNLADVKVVAGDYHEKQLSAVMQQNALVANVVDTWKARWGKDKTLVFCVDRVHAQMMQARFQDAGIPCGYQDANTPTAERREIERKFNSGELPVVCNIQTLTTGVDWDVRCLVLARPTKSEMLFVQIIGRALRIAPGKEHALILDHSDTTARLGFVTDIHHEHLDDGKPKKKAKARVALPRVCKQCDMLLPPGERKCPNCGFELPKPVNQTHEKDGELVEMLPDGTTRRVGKRFVPLSEKEKFLAELKWIGVLRKYKQNWAMMQYMKRFGEWPPYSIRFCPPRQAGAEVTEWCMAQLHAYRLSKLAQPPKQPSP